MRTLALASVLCFPLGAFALPALYLPDDISGVRSMGMGDAFRGVGTSNDAINENPAGLVLNPHYEIAGYFAWDTAAPAAFWNGSVVDATTLPLALGVSYTHIGAGTGDLGSPYFGRYVGSSLRGALAYPVSDVLAVGISVNWLDFGGDVNGGNGVNAITGDAAIALHLSELLTVSAVGYNLIPVGTALAPRRVALGGSFGSDSTFRLDVDGVGTLTSQITALDLHAGGELFLAKLFAVRAGYFYSGITEQSFGSVGLGLVVPGFAIDVGYRNSILPWADHLFLAGLKFFVGS